MATQDAGLVSAEFETFARELGVPLCTPRMAIDAAVLCLKCGHGHIPTFIAEAGIGKSQMTRQIADILKLFPMFFFLAHQEREDMVGIPYPDDTRKSYTFLCEDTIRRLVDSNQPTLLVLDEWNRGEKPVMSAAFTMMEDRRFGSLKLPDNVYIMACMNPSAGNYLVNEAEKDPAFRRRLCFIAIRPDVGSWLEHAEKSKFHPSVIELIRNSPKALLDAESREAGKVYANPAAWEKVSQTIYAMEAAGMNPTSPEIAPVLRTKLAGHIGIAMSDTYVKFFQDLLTLINPHDIIFRYDTVGKVRVKRMLDKEKRDGGELSNVCQSVAVTLISQRPPAKDVAGNLAQFAADLPRDMVRSFMKTLMDEAESANDKPYLSDLAMEFTKYEAFKQAYGKSDASTKAVKEKKDGLNK